MGLCSMWASNYELTSQVLLTLRILLSLITSGEEVSKLPPKGISSGIALVRAMLGNELSDGEVTRCSAAF